MSLCMPQSCYK